MLHLLMHLKAMRNVSQLSMKTQPSFLRLSGVRCKRACLIGSLSFAHNGIFLPDFETFEITPDLEDVCSGTLKNSEAYSSKVK